MIVQELKPDGLPLSRACDLLNLCRAGCYYQPVDQTETDRETALLLERVEAIVLSFPGYGYRRVTAQLKRDGVEVNHKRVLTLMQRVVAVQEPEAVGADNGQ